MIKKMFKVCLVILSLMVLFGCSKKLDLESEISDLTLIEGDVFDVSYETNDKKGVTFKSSDIQVLNISDEGIISALKEGVAQITIALKSDPKTRITIDVIVHKKVTISVEQEEISLTEGQQHSMIYQSNESVTFHSSNPSVFTVDEAGIITAISFGEAVLTIRSSHVTAIEKTIDIIVRKQIDLSIEQSIYQLWVGQTMHIIYESNEAVLFESMNPEVAIVTQTGEIQAVSSGEVEVKVISSYDDTVFEVVLVTVYDLTQTIMISGPEKVNLNDQINYQVMSSPDSAYPFVNWESIDTSIVTIDAQGLLTALAKGVTQIKAISQYDDQIVHTLTIEVFNDILVDITKNETDQVLYLGLNHVFGQSLFNNLTEALNHSTSGATIYIFEGNYVEDIEITQDAIQLFALENTFFEGVMRLSASHIHIDGFNMSKESHIKNTKFVEHIIISNLSVQQITYDADAFIDLNTVSNISIYNNHMTYFNKDAIRIKDFLSGDIIIKQNVISHVLNAIYIEAQSEYDPLTTIKVERNQISHIHIGIHMGLLYGDETDQIFTYARFNEVSDYILYAASTHEGNKVDFTLNYWGSQHLDLDYFHHIDPYYLQGHYDMASQIILPHQIKPNLPIKIIVENPIDEIIIGETYELNYIILPFENSEARLRWITSDPNTLLINTVTGSLTPLRSGQATLTLRSSNDFSINTQITIKVTTTPGIELSSNHIINNTLVGDTFTLTAQVFPESIAFEPVLFASLNPEVASIDNQGIITTHQAGVVSFKVSLQSDSSVSNTYTIEVFETLNSSNLLDLLTTYQVTYTTPHKWIAVGTGFNYADHKYESVSRYYFGDIEINQSKMVPVSTGIRPGEPMASHPVGIDAFNPYNVYWVVIHDTANTNPGAGALSHANYLYNNAVAGNQLWVSWHFTIDDRFVYQHLPETERGFHAGDGSSLPGTSATYLGGGNRNGIGIEMGVNQDSDVYRTWQRTAKLSADLLVRYNLPRTHMKYHIDFSGKNCPQTLRNAGLIPLYETFTDIEYIVRSQFADALITFESHDLEYLDHHGRIILIPQRSKTVSYTITVTHDGITQSRTLYSYLPGTDR